MYRQFHLRNDDTRLTCWLRADDPRLKVGALVSLKGDALERYWEVLHVYETALVSPPETRWKVGGLL